MIDLILKGSNMFPKLDAILDSALKIASTKISVGLCYARGLENLNNFNSVLLCNSGKHVCEKSIHDRNGLDFNNQFA